MHWAINFTEVPEKTFKFRNLFKVIKSLIIIFRKNKNKNYLNTILENFNYVNLLKIDGIGRISHWKSILFITYYYYVGIWL